MDELEGYAICKNGQENRRLDEELTGCGWMRKDGYVWYRGHVAGVYHQGWMGSWQAMAG